MRSGIPIRSSKPVQPASRLGPTLPREVARAALFLAADGSSVWNGIELWVAGRAQI
ncbi:hypothetical protein C8K61_101599 [Pseudomonas sp. GV071]|nr:hypothetical protein C8K61_101599 [Pseudomonas sp. GV071]